MPVPQQDDVALVFGQFCKGVRQQDRPLFAVEAMTGRGLRCRQEVPEASRGMLQFLVKGSLATDLALCPPDRAQGVGEVVDQDLAQPCRDANALVSELLRTLMR